MSSKKQTVSFLRERFREVGFRPYAKHGQNFLIDLNLLDLLVRVADVNSSDVVLEVGAGTGSLTARIAERAAAVVTVEIDPHLAQLALEQLEGADNVTLLQQDALRNKNNFIQHLLHCSQRSYKRNHPNLTDGFDLGNESLRNFLETIIFQPAAVPLENWRRLPRDSTTAQPPAPQLESGQ